MSVDRDTFMRKLNVKEIHGYNAAAGLELLKPDTNLPLTPTLTLTLSLMSG